MDVLSGESEEEDVTSTFRALGAIVHYINLLLTLSLTVGWTRMLFIL